MPEGDTLYRVATTLRKALISRAVHRFDANTDAVISANRRTPVVGRLVTAVEAHGKHLLIVLRRVDEIGAGEQVAVPEAMNLALCRYDLVLHTHLRMTGSWHVYRPGEPWNKPPSNAKVVMHTDAFVAICFSAPVVELLTAREAVRHPQLSTRGPDAMTEDFDALAACDRLRRRADLPIGVAIMDQRAMSGVGNVYKSEVLFLQRVSPFTPVDGLDDATLDALVRESHKLLRANETRGIRRTNFALGEHDRLWVYGRSGSPCRVCGMVIKMRRQGVDGRSTYYCPGCQEVVHGEAIP